MTPHLRHQARFVRAMGGRIDTGGKAAVALRLDHGLTSFRDKILPLTRARGIKVAQAYNPRRWHLPENEGVTATDLNRWVADGDVEIWNHSATHTPASTKAEIYDQVVGGLAEIRAELPDAQVWGFAPPGVSRGDWLGFKEGRQPHHWNTYAGELILRYHAVAAGLFNGTQIRELDGVPKLGQAHYTIDAMPLETVKRYIARAIDQRGGLQLMLHPSALDRPGKLTSYEFNDLLDYIVYRRNRGLLVTLSPYEMMVADSGLPRR